MSRRAWRLTHVATSMAWFPITIIKEGDLYMRMSEKFEKGAGMHWYQDVGTRKGFEKYLLDYKSPTLKQNMNYCTQFCTEQVQKTKKILASNKLGVISLYNVKICRKRHL